MKLCEFNPQAVAVNAAVSLVRHAKDVHATKSELSDVLDCIANGRWRVPVGKIRRTYSLASQKGCDPKDAVRDLKKALPGILFSGQFSRRANAALVSHSGLLCADLDDIAARLDDVRAKLKSSPHLLALFTSPTGTGLKAIFRVPADATQHRASFDAVSAHVRALTGCEIDPACKDVARLCFVSYDPEMFVNYDAFELTPSLPHTPTASVTSAAFGSHQSPSVASVSVCKAPEMFRVRNLDEAVSRALPDGLHRTNACLFELARGLRTLEALNQREFAAGEIRDAFSLWHEKAKPFLRADEKSRDDYLVELLNAFSRVRFPLLAESLSRAWRLANDEALPAEALQFEDKPKRLLVALCWQLQRIAGEQPFFLSARDAGRLLGVSHVTAATWLRASCVLQIVREVEKGRILPDGQQRASRYRYLNFQPTTKALI